MTKCVIIAMENFVKTVTHLTFVEMSVVSNIIVRLVGIVFIMEVPIEFVKFISHLLEWVNKLRFEIFFVK